MVLCFCAVAIALWVGERIGIPFDRWMSVSWNQAVAEGEIWRLATYALIHAGPLHLLWVVVPSLWLGWFLEPRLGSEQTFGLMFLCAMAFGVYYISNSAEALSVRGGGRVAAGLAATYLLFAAFHWRAMPFLARLCLPLVVLYQFMHIPPPWFGLRIDAFGWFFGWMFVPRMGALGAGTQAEPDRRGAATDRVAGSVS